MATEIETIGLGMDTSGIQRGIKSLDELASRGPKVEQSLQGVERAAKQASQGVGAISGGSAQGLEKMGAAGRTAAQGLDKLAQSARSAVSSPAALAEALGRLSKEETKFVQSLADEARQMGMTRGERAAYIAQSRGMSQSAQEIARAVGSKIDALKAESAALGQNERAMQSAQTAAAGFARSLVAAVAGGVAFREFVQAADAVTTLNNQLKLATGSADAARTAYASLYDIAQRSRVSFTELGTTYASIARATGEMGISQQRLLKVTESIGNAMTISGGSAQGMQAALVQLGQGFASGTLRGEELNSVMEQTPRLAKAIADGLGISIGKLREMGQAGQLTSEAVVKALESQAAVLQKEVAGATLTVGQAFTQLSNSTTKTIGEFDQATGASGALAEAISSIAGTMDGLGSAFARNEPIIKTTMGALAGGAALASLAALPRAIAAIGGAITGLGAVLAANPVVLGLLGVGAVVGGGVAAVNAYKKTADGIKSTIDALEKENARAQKALDWSAGMGGAYQKGDDRTRQLIADRTAQIAKLRDELLKLESSPVQGAGGGRGTINPPTVAEMNATQAKNDEALTEARRKLLGVNKDYLAELKKLNDLHASGALGIDEYRAMVGKLATDTYKASTAGKEAAAALRGTGKAAKETGDAFAAQRDAAKTWASTLQKAERGIAGVENKTLGLNAAQALLVEYLQSPAYQQNTEEMRQMALARLYAWDAAIKHADALAEEKKAIEAADKAIGGWTDARTKDADALDKQIAALQEEVNAIGLSAEAVAELAAAKTELAAATEEEYAANLRAASAYAGEFKGAYEQAARDAEARAAKLRDKARLERTRGEKKAAKEAEDAWQKSADQINQSLTDALLRGFESGKGFAENLRDTLKNMFNTLVLRPIISAIVQPVSLVINGMVQGVLGGVGLGGGGGGLVGMASNAYSLGSGAYSLYTGGFGATIPGQLWAGYTGATLPAGMVGPSVTAPTMWSNAGYAVGNGFGGGGAAASAMGSGAWMMAGAAAVLGLVANAMGMFGEDRRVGGGLTGEFGKGNIRRYELWRESGTLFGGPEYTISRPGEDASSMVRRDVSPEEEARYRQMLEDEAKQGKALDDAFIALRTNTLKMAEALGLSTDHLQDWTTSVGTDLIHPDTGGLGIDFEGLDQAGIAKKIQEALETANNQLAEQLIGSWVTTTETVRRAVETLSPSSGDDQQPGQWEEVEETITRTTYVQSVYAREGEKAIDTLTRLATSLSTVNGVFETLGMVALEASLASGDLASSFADLLGGLEGLTQAANTYYQNFYSDEERRDKAKEQLDKEFERLGLEKIDWDDPNARQKYRELVEREQARMVQEQKNREELRTRLDGDIAFELKPDDLGKVDWRAGLNDILGDPARELTQEELDRIDGVFASFGAGETSIDSLKESIADIIGPALGAGKSAEETTAALLGLSGAAASVTMTAEQAAQAAENARQQAIRSAYDLFRKAADRDRRALQEQASGIADTINAISGAVETLKDNARELYGEVDSTAQMLASQGMVYIEQALGGVRAGGSLVDYDRLDEAISAARGGISSGAYATQFERDRDTLVLAGQLSELGELGDLQLSIEERQLKAINEQIEYLDNLVKRADELVNGTAALTETVDSYFARLIELLTPKKPETGKPATGGGGGGGFVSGPGPTTGPAYDRDADVRFRVDQQLKWGDKQGLGHDDAKVLWGINSSLYGSGVTQEDIARAYGVPVEDINRLFDGAGIPRFDVGTNRVPRDMLAVVHKDEAIVPKPFNPWAGGQAMGGNSELVAEVRALRQEVAELRGAAVATASNTAGLPILVDIMDNVTEGGNEMRTTGSSAAVLEL